MAKSSSKNLPPSFLLTDQNCSRINIAHLRQLESMGYPRRVCAEALKQSNNRLEEAGEMLLTNFETLQAACRSAREHREEEPALTEDPTLIPQLIELGADYEEARALLDIHGNRLERAAEELLQKLRNPSPTAGVEQNPTADLLERARVAVEKRGNRKRIHHVFSLTASIVL